MTAGVTQRILGAVKLGRLYLAHRKGLTAATTQTQSAATALNSVIHYIATCANSGDGVKLPEFEESKIAIVINAGAQPCRVYSKETSGVTIGATAGSTGILLAAGDKAVFIGGTAGRWDVAVIGTIGAYAGALDGVLGGVTPAAATVTTLTASGAASLAGVTSSGNIKRSVGAALTAVGTNRATALALTKDINRVTSAAASTGVNLPTGVVGMEIDVYNDGANAIQVYAAGSETIDTVAGSTGVPLTNAKRARFTFTVANTWISAQWGVVSA